VESHEQPDQGIGLKAAQFQNLIGCHHIQDVEKYETYAKKNFHYSSYLLPCIVY